LKRLSVFIEMILGSCGLALSRWRVSCYAPVQRAMTGHRCCSTRPMLHADTVTRVPDSAPMWSYRVDQSSSAGAGLSVVFGSSTVSTVAEPAWQRDRALLARMMLLLRLGAEVCAVRQSRGEVNLLRLVGRCPSSLVDSSVHGLVHEAIPNGAAGSSERATRAGECRGRLLLTSGLGHHNLSGRGFDPHPPHRSYQPKQVNRDRLS
jgi:hypothetical protein